MDDLISRQAAIDAVKRVREHHAYDEIEELEALPSAQSEIIRCKDCKHYKITDNRAFGFPVKRCKWTGFEDVDDDDFCSRAERRTDE